MDPQTARHEIPMRRGQLARLLRLAGLMLGATLLAVPVAAQTDRPLRIGVLEDMSSVYADNTGSGSVVAARLALEDFGPTVLGRRIEIVEADHQNKADVGSAIARRWYDVDGVDLVTGLGNSAVALAVRNVAREQRKVDIVVSGGHNDLTGKACSPTGFHWVYNTHALAKTVGAALVRSPGETFFFVAADYTFGISLARDGARFAEEAGGKVLNTVRAPLNTSDYSSFILQAQASKARHIGLAMSGADLVNFVKQSVEFGVTRNGQSLAALITFINDIHALGLPAAQGMYLAETFYWDTDAQTRAFAQRFHERRRIMPNGTQAGVYSAVRHYLRAVQAAGTTEGVAVAEKIRELPIDDFFSHGVRARADGRVMRDLHLYQVKTPAESRGPWDLMKHVRTVAAADAFPPLTPSECPLVSASR